MRICVAVPLHNAESWLADLSLNPEYDYRFFDNASTDATREILESRGFAFVSSNQLLARPDSWIQAYKFACETDTDWIKPLFAGDSLASGLSKIEISDPEVGIILLSYKVSARGNVARTARKWNITGDLARDISIYGPFVGPPIAMMFSKSAILSAEQELLKFYSEWLADFEIFEALAQKSKYIFIDKVAGIFHSSKRKTFIKLSKNVSYFAQEMQLMIRYRKQIEPVITIDKLRITKRIVDLGLHRLPNPRALGIILINVLNVWS